jgi:DNA replication protein DnaC
MDELPNFGAKVGTETRSGNCAEHGDFVSTGFKFGDRVMHWSICPQCAALEKASAEVEAKKRESEERQKRLEAKLNQTGIPLRYRAKNFMTYVADTDEKEHALAVATEFASNFAKHRADGTFLVFSGLPGTGKSHLAISIAQEVMGRYTALYTSAIDAVRTIRDTWRRDSQHTESQVLKTFASIDLLVLDEVGVQYGTEAEQVNLFDIIDKRYRDSMPTILITNQNRTGLKNFLGDRSFDRLRENGIWVKCDWESVRGAVSA